MPGDVYSDMDRRIAAIEQRLDFIDQHGTRQIGVLQLQIQELVKDVGEVKGSRFTSWLVYVATVIPLYALTIAILVQHHP